MMSKLKWLKNFVAFYGLATVIVTFDKWLWGWIVQISPERQALTFSYETFMAMGLEQRLLGFFNEGILTALFLGVLFHLYNTLKNVELQQTFSQYTLGGLGKMAKLYLGYTILFPITMAIQSVITTWHNPPGQKTLTISIMGTNFDQILMAGCLYMLWHVMAEASQISTEHSMVI